MSAQVAARRQPRAPRRRSPGSTASCRNSSPASPPARCRCWCRSTSLRCCAIRPPAPTVDAERYFSGFHAARFFYPGPAGYDAAFAIRTSDVPELADSKFAEPIEVQISGSALLYDLDAPIVVEGQPVAALEEEFPGIRRMILEHHLRYTFVRFGVPYVVSIACFDAGVVALQDADLPVGRSGRRSASCVRFASSAACRAAFARRSRCRSSGRQRVSHSFGYYGPGQLLSGTGFHGQGGRADYTVYSQIRFPLAEAPAFAALRGVPAPQPRAAAEADDTLRADRCPGATISANAAAFRSASAPPASAIRARTSGPARASRRPARSAAPTMATSSRSATASSCARRGRRRPTCSSTPPTSTSGSATCT